MSEIGDDFKYLREQKQKKRQNNRESSAVILKEHKIHFTEHNNGAHLIVEGQECFIDFWPGTGKWVSRNGPSGFGVFNLVEYINQSPA